MSEKQFETCTLEEATHVEMGGKVYELGIADGYESKHQVLKYNKFGMEVYMESAGWQRIYAYSFHILGIKPLREKKRKPIEFEKEFVMYDGKWYASYSLEHRFPDNNKKKKFKCVEILEEEE